MEGESGDCDGGRGVVEGKGGRGARRHGWLNFRGDIEGC